MLDTAAKMLPDTARAQALILWFDEVGIDDIQLVGGKNASLGEMIQQLAPRGVNGPNGFATTAAAYRYFIAQAGLAPKLQRIFADLDVNDLQNLQHRGEQARSLMLNTPFPQDLEFAIAIAYAQLCERYPHTGVAPIAPDLVALHNTDVAVRSSATAEDLPDASFAGQQETYLNVQGVKQVLAACHKCFASILPIGRFLTARREVSTIWMWIFLSGFKRWCDRI